MQYALEIDNLKKSYGDVQAIRGVSFHIKPGEIYGLLGPNGAGKTSLISIITSLEKPQSGTVRIFGRDISSGDRMTKSLVGCVPQEVISHGFFTVEEVLHFVSGYYGLQNNTQRIHALLKHLRLWEHKNKKIPHLSGGLKRRFMIAKALVHAPKLLLLDEPTAGLDIELRASLLEFVKSLNQTEGLSLLLTTHYLEEAQQLCDTIGILDQGLLKKSGHKKQLIKELTLRHVVLKLSREINKPLQSPYLIKQGPHQVTLKLPYDLGVGEVIDQMQIAKYVFDIEVHEGNLEDVFINVVGKNDVVT